MRVLIAEDEAVSRRRLELLLGRWDYDVVSAADGSEAWRLLSGADPPRLAILDWMMPGFDGVSLCRKVRDLKDEPYVYILLLTTRDKDDHLIEAMGAGADDFLSKPFKPHELEARLRAGTRICELQEDLIQAREALRDQATRDVLTDCWNRRAILANLDRELERTDRSGQGSDLGVLIGDLDHFKTINDTHGHLVGDEVLRETVRRISNQMRPYDCVGRFGGEEFLILLAHCEGEQSEAAAERLRSAIADRPFETSAGPLSVSMSLGGTTIAPGSAVSPETVLTTADRALYSAKAEGRNRSCFKEVPRVTPPQIEASRSRTPAATVPRNLSTPSIPGS